MLKFNYETRYVRLDDGHMEECDPVDADYYAVYQRPTTGAKLAEHIADFPVSDEGHVETADNMIAALKSAQKRMVDSAEQVAIQAAMFSFNIDFDRYSPDMTEGQVGLAQKIAYNAGEFEDFHVNAEAESGSDCYWEDESQPSKGDWYFATDEWFTHHIQDEIYELGESEWQEKLAAEAAK